MESGREFWRVGFEQGKLLSEGGLDFGLSEENHGPHKDLGLFPCRECVDKPDESQAEQGRTHKEGSVASACCKRG